MYSLSIIILAMVPTALMFFFSSSSRRVADLHPLKVLGWALLIGYTLKGLYLAYAVNFDAPFKTEALSAEIIPFGQIAICIGLIAYMVGFLFLYNSEQQIQTDPRPRYSASSWPELIYYPLFIAGLGLMIIYFYQMDFWEQITSLRFRAQKWFFDEEGTRSTLGFLTLGGEIVLVYFLYYVSFVRKINWASIYIGSLGFISLCYLLASRRNGILLIIASFLMVTGIRKLRQKANNKAIRNLIIVLAFILLAFVSAIRGGGRDGTTMDDLSLVNSVETSMQHMFEGAYFVDPAKTAAIVDQTEKRDLYMGGESFVAVAFAPIPRILWPEKPDIRIGPYVAQIVLFYDNNSGVPPGGIGELFLNFGWLGIVFGMLLLGALTALLYNRYNRAYDKRFARPLYALMLICFMLFLVSDFASAILSLIRYAVSSYVCILFWRKMVALGRVDIHVDPQPRRSVRESPNPAWG